MKLINKEIANLWNAHADVERVFTKSVRNIFHDCDDILSLFDDSKPIIVDDLSYVTVEGKLRDYDFAKDNIIRKPFIGVIIDNKFRFMCNDKECVADIICCKSNVF